MASISVVPVGSLVFDCLSKPELVRRWLLGPPGYTMPVCEIDLRVSGRFRYVWRSPDGNDLGMGGVYREIVRPEGSMDCLPRCRRAKQDSDATRAHYQLTPAVSVFVSVETQAEVDELSEGLRRRVTPMETGIGSRR